MRRGRKVVLYFYLKDDTPGCTVQGCSFRDEHSALQKAGAGMLGVWRDKRASHGEFRAKYELPFDLLSDRTTRSPNATARWVRR